MHVALARPSLRSRQTLALRQEIVQASMALFLANGFDETTVEDIAEKVGISSRTVFRHYAGKEDIVLSGLFEAAERMREKVVSCPPDQAPMECARQAYLQFAREPHGVDFMALARLIVRTPRLQARALQMSIHWEDAMVRGLAERGDADAADAHVTAAVAVSVARMGMRRWLASDGRRSIEECIDEAFLSLHRIKMPCGREKVCAD